MNLAPYVEISPRIFRSHQEQSITIVPRFPGFHLPDHALFHFADGDRFQVTIRGVYHFTDPFYYPFEAIAKDGRLSFSFAFDTEQEYLLSIRALKGSYSIETSLYALDEDLFGLYALKGDLHMHTSFSDGYESPVYRAAMARMRGLDFMALTDHNSYEGSVQLIKAMAKHPHRMVFIHGEEVHATGCPVHILSLGAREAVFPKVFLSDFLRELLRSRQEQGLTECPSTQEIWDYACARYGERMRALLAEGPERELDLRRQAEQMSIQLSNLFSLTAHYRDKIPADVDPTSFITAINTFDRIRDAGGLSVLCHIYWNCTDDSIHKQSGISEALARALAENRHFDAFELVSGYPSYDSSSNYLQDSFYEEYLRGQDVPVIGITDTHSTLPGFSVFGRNFSIVWTQQFDEDGVLDAIRKGRSVAVDGAGGNAICRGPLRYVKFTRFLLKHFFPAHDRTVLPEGYLLERIARLGDKEDQDLNSMLGILCARHEELLSREWAPLVAPVPRTL